MTTVASDAMTTSSADSEHERRPSNRVSLEELARRKNVRPITSAEDLACEGIFETDEELYDFLAHVAAQRRANLV